MAGIYPGATMGGAIQPTPQPTQQPGILPSWVYPAAGAGVVGGAGLGAGLAYRANGVTPFARAVPSSAEVMGRFPGVGYSSGINPMIGSTAQQQANQWFDQAMSPLPRRNPLMGPVNPNVNIMADAAQAVGATPQPPAAMSWERLRSNALLRNTAPDAMAEGMGAAPALTGGARAKSYAGMAGKGLVRGLGGVAISTGGNALADMLPANSAARPGIRSVGNVGGAMFAMPAIGGLPAALASIPATLGAEGFSRSAAGNEVINASRNASTNPLANFAVNLNPILGGEQAIRKLADLMGGGDGGIDLSNRTNDTVFDIFGGEGGGAQAVTPEQQQQRIAQTSPDALVKVTTDYGLSPEMSAKLVDNYRKSMVLAQAQGGVPLQVDKEGKLGDGTLAKDRAGVRAVTREDGTTSYMSSDPTDIQEAVYTRSLQEIPLLAQQQSQEEDYMRKQALMQAQLEEAIPQYFGGASWAADPTAQMLAAASIRDIPSRYVQAQSMQTQQGINSQIEQAQIQQMLAQQYPELFGRQSSSQPATLDAAMAQ